MYNKDICYVIQSFFTMQQKKLISAARLDKHIYLPVKDHVLNLLILWMLLVTFVFPKNLYM